jgi:hypothetical protein
VLFDDFVPVSFLNISTDCARRCAAGGSAGFVGSGGSDGVTDTMSTSSFWLDATSESSRSEARLFSGDEALCGRSAAPPIIALCENDLRGDLLLIESCSVGASEALWVSAAEESPPLSPSMQRLA